MVTRPPLPSTARASAGSSRSARKASRRAIGPEVEGQHGTEQARGPGGRAPAGSELLGSARSIRCIRRWNGGHGRRSRAFLLAATPGVPMAHPHRPLVSAARILLALVVLVSPLGAADFVWWEGEAASETNF